MPRPKNPNLTIGLIVGGVAAAIFLGVSCVVGVLVLRKDAATGRGGAAGGSAVLEVKGFEIEEDFRRNVIDADRKWIGKRVRMTAAVQEIGRDGRGFYLILSPATTIRSAEADVSKFAAVNRFDMVKVEVTLRGYSPGDPIQLEGTDAVLIANQGPFFKPDRK